jgi:translocation and assembly module TamB
VVATSGKARPLEASGAWTPQGGQAGGRVSLTASRLAAPYAERLGPDARFQVNGRTAPGGFFALDGRIAAENLTATISGLGDPGQRKVGPQGLRVAVSTAALSRLTGGPAMGPALAGGTVTQTRDGWRFEGRARADRIDVGAYELARAEGPVTLQSGPGGTAFSLGLAGAGGRGAGYVAALFGASPRAVVDAQRLKDGRLEVKRLEVSGPGLKLDASGGQGLLGGLGFKGQAQVSNLAAARPGAGGAAALSWSASQAKAGQPWVLGLDAHGDRFATGFPELDRLLGPKPQLKVQANVQGRKVSVGQAALTGQAASLTSSGVLDPDGRLSFKVDWSAAGPFEAGPLEIAGKAKGTGALTGTLGQPKADILAHLDSVDLPRLTLTGADVTLSFTPRPDGAAGEISVAAGSAYGPARGRAAFAFPEGGVDLKGLSVDAGGLKATGDLALRKRALTSADLQVALGPGAFLDAGKVSGQVKVADAPGGARATVALTAENVQGLGAPATVRQARLTADGPLKRLPYELRANGGSDAGAWTLDGHGALSDADAGLAATFDGAAKLGARTLRTTETATVRLTGAERGARLRLAASDGGRIDLDSRMTDAAADVRAKVEGLNLQALDEDLAGRIDADVALQGRGPRLDGTLNARLAGARGRGAPASSGVEGTVTGRLAGDALTLTAQASNGQGLKANADLAASVEASAAPFRLAAAGKKPLSGRFSAQGEVRPLWDLLVGGERSLSGQVRTEGTFEGTPDAPSARGQIVVENGRFDDGGTGLTLRQVSLKAGFAREAVDVTEAKGVDGAGGQASGSGRISLAPNGISSFRLDLNGFRLIDNEFGIASASGQATINRAADGKVQLSGALTIDKANLTARLPNPSGVVAMDVVERNRPAGLGTASTTLPPPAEGEGWGLDVTMRAPRNIFLKGRGLDAELSLDAHVGGSTAHPVLTGQARVVRGSYDFAGKRFDFDEGSVVYLSTHAREVRLQLAATRDDPSLSATVRIRGNADKPEITLTSTPALPSDEVLSQVLFGSSASQLNGAQAAELASAVSGLAGGGGFDVLGNLRAFAGLDRLALGGSVATGTTLSGGKYLTRDVYLELTGGGRAGPSAQVEWRVRPHLSIIARGGGAVAATPTTPAQGSGALSIRWRKDY